MAKRKRRSFAQRLLAGLGTGQAPKLHSFADRLLRRNEGPEPTIRKREEPKRGGLADRLIGSEPDESTGLAAKLRERERD